jgi:tetratricopeptide (TPR) repeat protein
MVPRKSLTQQTTFMALCVIILGLSACSEPNDKKIEVYTSAAFELLDEESVSKEDLKLAEELLARAWKAMVFDDNGVINHIGSIAKGYQLLGYISESDCDYEAAISYHAQAAKLLDIPPASIIVRLGRGLLGNQPLKSTWYDIALLYAELGRYQEAAGYLARAYGDLSKGWNIFLRDGYYSLLGEIYTGQGKYSQAEAAFRRDLADNGLSGYAKANLAAVLHTRGKHEEAEREFRDAITILEEGFEDSHELAVTMSNYSKMLNSLGRLDEAQQYAARAQMIREKRLRKAKDIIAGASVFPPKVFYCLEVRRLRAREDSPGEKLS